MKQTRRYSVPEISSGHCRAAITAEVGALPGVDSVTVDLEAKRVAVTGDGVGPAAVRAAIRAAGYQASESRGPAELSVDVVVIGAGQAGLAMGHSLARRGRRFVILDAADAVGSAWRNRWDSLTLFTPRRYSALPGLAFPGDPDGYPARDEVVAYLEQYAAAFDLPIRFSSAVRSLTRRGRRFLIELDDMRVEADHVVVATGPFQQPRMPALARELAADLIQLHSAHYRRPDDLPAGRVLVVGGGNTGYQIAAELAATHEVHLAIGSRQTPLPQRLLGRDLFWWLTRLGLIRKTVDSRLGRRARHRDMLIGSSPRKLSRRHGVTLRSRAVGASGRTVRFADGSELEPDAVVWATGYRADYSWIDLPVLDGDGRPRHRRGVTDVPGLYFLGLSWQHTRGSALVGWVGDDAQFIAGEIDALAGATAGVDDSSADDYEAAPTPQAAGAMERI